MIKINFAGCGSLGVRNATVSLQDTQGTAYSTTSDANGNFTLLNVPFNTYQLVVTAPDMDTLTQSVSLNVGNLPVNMPSKIPPLRGNNMNNTFFLPDCTVGRGIKPQSCPAFCGTRDQIPDRTSGEFEEENWAIKYIR